MNKQNDNAKTVYGYGHDFIIFTPGLSDKTLPQTVGNLKIEQHQSRVLSDYRGFIADGAGNLYDVSAQGELGGVLFLKTVSKLDTPFFPWMTKEETSDIEVVEVDPAYVESIKELLSLALETSPIGKIYLYIRHQSDLGASNVAGTLSVDRFMDDVVGKGNLLSSFVYVLSKNAETDLMALVNEAVNQNS
jgi:hypothetical protein